MQRVRGRGAGVTPSTGVVMSNEGNGLRARSEKSTSFSTGIISLLLSISRHLVFGHGGGDGTDGGIPLTTGTPPTTTIKTPVYNSVLTTGTRWPFQSKPNLLTKVIITGSSMGSWVRVVRRRFDAFKRTIDYR